MKIKLKKKCPLCYKDFEWRKKWRRIGIRWFIVQKEEEEEEEEKENLLNLINSHIKKNFVII